MARRRPVGILCPRCGSVMVYHIELELQQDGTRIVNRYYRCPVCRYKIIDSRVVLRRINGKLISEIKESRLAGLKTVYDISNKRVTL